MRWLRQTAGRGTPIWLRYFAGLQAVVVYVALIYVAPDLSIIQRVIVGMVIAGILVMTTKLVWAAMNPVSEPDDPESQGRP